MYQWSTSFFHWIQFEIIYDSSALHRTWYRTFKRQCRTDGERNQTDRLRSRFKVQGARHFSRKSLKRKKKKESGLNFLVLSFNGYISWIRRSKSQIWHFCSKIYVWSWVELLIIVMKFEFLLSLDLCHTCILWTNNPVQYNIPNYYIKYQYHTTIITKNTSSLCLERKQTSTDNSNNPPATCTSSK